MSIINNKFLQSIGVQLSPRDIHKLSEHFQETLHDRIIEQVIMQLTPEQVEQLNSFAEGDPALQHWLMENIEDLKDIIQDEVDILLGELAEAADQIATDQ
ncbi:MAG: hypothetical protein WAU02_00805 [Candidatus Saccharimonadales bacterium]